MTDIFVLDTEPNEAERAAAGDAPDSSIGVAATPTSSWQPSAKAESLSALSSASAPTKKAKGQKEKKSKQAVLPEDKPVKLLPAPKPTKPLSKSAQKKADKAQLIKEREADAATMRINGVDDANIEIPKKPWLTLFSGKRARPDEVAETLTDLASMLENGQSELRSITELATVYADYDIGQAYQRVVMLLERGVTLSKALADQEDEFPPVVRELIAAAKMPKDMHRNLRQAAIIIIEGDNIKSQIKSSLFQPGFMLGFLTVFTLAGIHYLLPMTVGMFTQIGAEVPPLTVFVMGVGDFVKFGVLGVILVIFLWTAFWTLYGKKNEQIARMTDSLALKAPLVGEIMRMSVAARFCDVLAACLSVGMSELESLTIAGRASGNRSLASWADEHVGRQRAGLVTFSDVAKTELLPWNFRNRIETTTSMTRRISILHELAETFHFKSQQRLNRFAERVGPITQGVVVIVVVFVVLLLVSPILSFVPTMLETIG